MEEEEQGFRDILATGEHPLRIAVQLHLRQLGDPVRCLDGRGRGPAQPQDRTEEIRDHLHRLEEFGGFHHNLLTERSGCTRKLRISGVDESWLDDHVVGLVGPTCGTEGRRLRPTCRAMSTDDADAGRRIARGDEFGEKDERDRNEREDTESLKTEVPGHRVTSYGHGVRVLARPGRAIGPVSRGRTATGGTRSQLCPRGRRGDRDGPTDVVDARGHGHIVRRP